MAAPTKEESRAYSRGYAAGKRRTKSIIRYEQIEADRKRFAEKVFLTMLPVAMQVQGWTIGEEKITNSDQRINLAVIWTKKAVKQRGQL